MDVKDFDFELPEHLIAQEPLLQRDTSKLLVLNKNNGSIKHDRFNNILSYLKPSDVLVVNDSRVLPARLFGTKKETGGNVELLLLENKGDDVWECLVKPAKKIKKDTQISFGDGILTATCTGYGQEGIRYLKMEYQGIFLEVLDQLGEMPLPPYIKLKLEDKERYQTVYSKEVGSAAAPTAGLHFTTELLEKIKALGVTVCYVTLHVGLGTFRPVMVDDINDHRMHSEFYHMDQATADCLNQAKKAGQRIISVGTTSTRTLETIMNHHHEFKACSGYTDIFIYPGYEFKAIDALITNFHLPKSTLMMLISALASKEIIMNAYQEAINHEYRFFSFGDSMFITNE